jgi:hypothetical protein
VAIVDRVAVAVSAPLAFATTVTIVPTIIAATIAAATAMQDADSNDGYIDIDGKRAYRSDNSRPQIEK